MANYDYMWHVISATFIDKVKVSGETILVRNKIPWRSLAISSIMFVGIIIIQIPQASEIHLNIFLLDFYL